MAKKRKLRKTSAKKTLEQRRFEVLLENFQGQLDTVSENTTEILSMKPMVYKLLEDMDVLKTDNEVIKGPLKRKVDADEFAAFTKRVLIIEKHLRFGRASA